MTEAERRIERQAIEQEEYAQRIQAQMLTPFSRGTKLLLPILKLKGELEATDNRKLAWLLLKTAAFEDASQVEEIILQEVIKRLYPEWNGRDVQITERGWITPEGEIIY